MVLKIFMNHSSKSVTIPQEAQISLGEQQIFELSHPARV